MKFRDYFTERLSFFLINFIIFSILAAVMLLVDTAFLIIALIFFIWFVPLLALIVIEFFKLKRFFRETNDILENLDQGYLLSEIITEPNFIEGKFVYDLLQQANKDMHEHVKKYKDMESEYREYIETWVHEIKTPISSARLIIDNNPSETSKNINQEIKKIEEYIEQVLYYARSNNVGRDYIIREVSLIDVVRTVVKRNSRAFIDKKIAVKIDEVEGTVYSDAKWLEFILNQLIGNAIKYITEGNGIVSIRSERNEHSIVLTIKDNGIGITESDLDRVFEKGFTGENGRLLGQSTGIGLYLCKKLADQLGLGLKIRSKSGMGTALSIVFPLENAKLLT